jgi:hypothetical protein
MLQRYRGTMTISMCCISVEKECVCYDEESGEGKEDCKQCEGYGLVTEYVG